MLSEKDIINAIYSCNHTNYIPAKEERIKECASGLYNYTTESWLDNKREGNCIAINKNPKLEARYITNILYYMANRVNRKNQFKKNYYIVASSLKVGNDVNVMVGLGLKSGKSVIIVGSMLITTTKGDDGFNIRLVGGYNQYRNDTKKMLDGIFSK